MNRVNLVFIEDDWILARSAKEINRYMPEVTMNGDCGQINYFINYMAYEKISGVKVAQFTHLEEEGRPRRMFLKYLTKVDYCVALSDNTADILRDNGAKDVRVIHYGVAERRPLKFGVCGRVYGSGRKGEYLVKNMVDAGYDVTALGKGWPCPEVQMDKAEFFEGLDYYVVTSLNEGGPHSVLDALAYGVPVIAPDVGWCWEYSTIGYDKGDWNSLLAVLKGLQPRLWSDWAEDHKKLFEEISDGSR